MYYPFLRCLLCKANSLMVSLHWQLGVCFGLPVPCCPHLCDPTTAAMPAQNLSGTSAPFTSCCCFMSPSHSTGNWTHSKSKLMPLINLFIVTLTESLAKSTKYMQVITKYCSQGEHWNMKIFSTYSGTEDQCNVFMIANGSERNLRQGVVILWFRQCRIQEHHIILWVKNILRLQHQEQSKIKISFKGKGQLNRLQIFQDTG